MQIFVKTLPGNNFPIDVEPSDTIHNIKSKIQNFEKIPHNQQKILFRNKVLHEDSTLEQCNVKNGDTIYLSLNLEGGAIVPVSFADISNEDNAMIKHFDESAPNYRIVANGLNIEGLCSNTTCEAFGNIVIHQNHFKSFDLSDPNARVCCPLCFTKVIPRTMGITCCCWRFEGSKLDNKKQISDWKKVGNYYYRFNGSQDTIWNELIIHVKPLEDLSVKLG